MEPIKINIKINPNNHVSGELAVDASAYADNNVKNNWISQSLVDRQKLDVSSVKKAVYEDWGGQKLQATSLVQTSWSRNDVQTPVIFDETIFHVVATNSFDVLIGNQLLAKDTRILNPKNAVLPLVSAKRSSAEEEERKKTMLDHQAKLKRRELVKEEAIKAEEAKQSMQDGSSNAGGSSSKGGL